MLDALMFVFGAAFGGRPVTGRQEALFWQGYGPTDVDWPALAYYRYERAVTDIDEFARAVLLRDDLSEAAKRNDLGWFRRMFALDSDVALARSFRTPTRRRRVAIRLTRPPGCRSRRGRRR